MKRNQLNRDRRLLEALDYLDEAYVADVVDNLKLPPAPGVPMPKKGRILRSIKPVAMLVACTLLLAALIPAVTYLTSHFPDIVAFFRGEHTEMTVPEETDPYETPETTAPPETTEPIKHEHDGTEGLIYRVNDDGMTVTLVSRGTCENPSVTVASTYDGLPVIAIGDSALEGGQYERITIPEGITSIGIGAFKSCTELKSIYIPATVRTIGANAFENCIALKSIILPDSLEIVSTGLFTNCEALQHVRIGNQVKRILAGAFYGCYKLPDLEFGGIKQEWAKVGIGDFWNMECGIKYVHCNDGSVEVTTAPKGTPEDNGSPGLEYRLSGTEARLSSLGTCTEKNIVIASTYMGYPVTSIGSNVFDGYSELESVSIPETVVSIRSRAFADCKNLESVTLPVSLTLLYPDAFVGCTSLGKIEIDGDNPAFKVVDNSLIETAGSVLIMTCKSSRIPTDGSIRVIGEYALSGLERVEIAIPEGVRTIRANALQYNNAIRRLSLPSTLESIDVNTFSESTSNLTLLFPNGHSIYTAEGNCLSDKSTKTLIRGFAFSTPPDWIEVIGNSAFQGCSGLEEIKFPSSLKTIGQNAFKNCTSLKKIKIDGAVTLKNYAFYGCTSLKSVELDDRVQFDYSHIFAYCTSLEHFRVPRSVTYLNGQWEGCTSLKTIVLHDDITFLSGSLFYGCTSLESFYIGPKVRELRQNFLVKCPNIKEIVYGGTRHEWFTVKKHESWMDGASKLAVVRCTDGDLTNFNTQPMVGSYGLLYRESADGKSAQFIGFKDGVLDSFEIASSYNSLPVTSVAEGALSKIKSSGTIIMSTYIETVEEGTFAQSPYVTHIELRPNVKVIENNAFIGCVNLKELTFRGTKAAWEKIEKQSRWNYGTALEVVHCIDGDVSVTPHPETNNGSEGLAYRINQSNSGDFYAVFTGLGTCKETDIVIAPDYYGYPVRELQHRVLQGKTEIKSVILPEGITAIPSQFFYECASLEKVTIPESVTVIDSHAFCGCTALKEIVLPDGLDSIGQYAFLGCTALKEIVLPEGLDGISEYAFAQCTSLSKVDIPDSVTCLDSSAFTDTLIDSIHISKNVTYIGSGVFGLNIKNITVDPENPVYVITGNCLIDRERKTLLRVFGEPEFPNDGSIRYISDSAFSNIDFEIKRLILPEGLEEVGWYISEKLTGLEELHIPSTFVDWNGSTFEYCANLKRVTVAEGNPRYYSIDNCVIDKDTGELVLGCNTSIIPNDGSVKSIGVCAFYNRAGLESVTIPEGVISIGHQAFCGCISLREVKLPESLEEIRESAFSHCSALEEIEFGANVNMINLHAFAYCTSLREVVIPENLYENCLGWDLFKNCTALEKVYVPRNVQYISFNGCTSLREIVYSGTVEEWNSIIINVSDFLGTSLERITCTDGVITEIPYETEMPLY